MVISEVGERWVEVEEGTEEINGDGEKKKKSKRIFKRLKIN